MNAQILERFDAATGGLITQLYSLTEKQLNQLPFHGSWTAGQVGDHLYKSYNILDTINGSVANTERDPAEKLPEVEKLFKDFTIKMKSPEEIEPTKKYIAKAHLLNSLKERIEKQREAIKTKDLSKTCLDFEIPGYGAFTRHEWLGFSTIHTERHNAQLTRIIEHVTV